MSRTYLKTTALLAFLAAGCGQGRGNVSGEVKFNGKPLPFGRITFLCQDEKNEVHNCEIRNGKYALAEIPAGPATITVAAFQPGISVEPPPFAGGKLAMPPRVKTKPANISPSGPPGDFVDIPRHYSLPDKSGLSCTIHSGDQKHDVELKADRRPTP